MKSAKDVAMDDMQHNMCLRPDCKRTSRIRGLCYGCYQAIRLMVKRNETSWDALEKAGIILPSSKRYRGDAVAWANCLLDKQDEKENES